MIYIIINSYQREEMLSNLIKQLREQDIDRHIYVKVYLDGCAYKHYEFGGGKFLVSYTRVEHHGREYYYKLMQKGWKEACVADYYINLPDDITVEKDFLSKAVSLYEKGSVLDLMKDNRDKGILKRFKDVSLVSSMDLCIMYDRSIEERLRGLYLKPRVERSSGVARELNAYFRKCKIPIYLVNETLVKHSAHESKMNPERTNDIIA